MTSPNCPPRPRLVDVAFWLLVVGAVLLMASGLFLALMQAPIWGLFRGAGVLFVVAGAALAFLAGRTRAGHFRFRNATIGLAMALAILLALFTVLAKTLLGVPIMILIITGAILLTRRSANDWFLTDGQRD